MDIFLRNHRAFSLIEVIVGIGILVLISGAIITMSLGSLSAVGRSEQQFQAFALAQEGLEAARAIRNFGWNTLTAGSHGLTDTNGYWELTSVPDTTGRFTRRLTVSDLNPYTKEVSIVVEWQGFMSPRHMLAMSTRLVNWMDTHWLQTLLTDFDQGLKNSVVTTNIGDGEFQLSPLGDFSRALGLASHDFGGTGDISDLFIEGNRLYTILTNNDSNAEGFSVFDISDISRGVITKIGGVVLASETSNLLVKDGYAYISTTENTQEVIIIRLSDYSKVNAIDIPSSANAHGIFIEGTRLYVTTSKSPSAELYMYDVSNPEGTFAGPSGSVELNSEANAVVVSGNYAYVGTGDDSGELVIIRLSDFARVNTFDVPGNADVRSLWFTPGVLHLGMRVNSANAEFYSIDVSVPEGVLSVKGAVEIGNDVSDIYLAGNTAYLATHAGGSEELAVVDITSYVLKTRIDILGSPNADSLWLHGAYLYVGSSNNTDTLQILQGGTLGDSGESSGYAAMGIFTSVAFDSGSDGTVYRELLWTQKGTGSVKFQIKTASTQASLSSAEWVGPDGTRNTYYTVSPTSLVLAPGAGHRFIQYQATLTGDGTATPLVEDVLITYAK